MNVKRLLFQNNQIVLSKNIFIKCQKIEVGKFSFRKNFLLKKTKKGKIVPRYKVQDGFCYIFNK